MTNQRKILLLEDNSLFANTLEDFLSTHDYCVDIANDGEDALGKHYKNRYDLYLLDINVPHINGLEFLKNLRESGDNIPAMFITSYKDKKSLQDAFECGCDDYIKKPCDLDELACRIKSLLKRAGNLKEKIQFSDYCYYCFAQRKVYHHGTDANLPQKSISLLELFIEHTDQIVTIEMIINRLWSPSQNSSENAIRAYITQLRQHVGKDKIVNLKGVGYKLNI